ncbi:alpha/beta fold hydrolase [Nonomuraea soli]|uniref:Pimeloyl-ACP methyl ester carboxylesterase n=1 Tax=Nonomuraea soli TaxID=1032476 RepID=A0A7W0HP16_9ACTN|nr:alpha/beta fold hydrolase [Nonomuraea soli]MBA2890156.1 pimeloyl-ACP methyl ester carboxylesterase [Nonomuraea soli]
MKQAIRFASTPGGRVAYSVAGSGPPVVYLLGWVSHLGLAWEVPSHRRFVEALAREHTVIRYDKLGCGLSDRPRQTFTLESELETLEALIGHLGLKRYTLFGSCEGGQVAAAHAARHPDAVASLLVYGSCARGDDLAPDPVKRSVLSLIEAHWGMGSRVLADIWLPGAEAEVAGMFARIQRAAATGETAAALLEMFYRIEVGDLLPEIRVPTLVLHRRDSRAVRFELGRELASLIPDAQFVALEGRMQPIYSEGEDVAAATILSFLRERVSGRRHAVADGPLTERQLQVVGLIAEGLTNAEIAQILGVSVRTVDAHVEHVRHKLGVRSRAQMAVWASRQRVGGFRADAPLPVPNAPTPR